MVMAFAGAFSVEWSKRDYSAMIVFGAIVLILAVIIVVIQEKEKD